MKAGDSESPPTVEDRTLPFPRSYMVEVFPEVVEIYDRYENGLCVFQRQPRSDFEREEIAVAIRALAGQARRSENSADLERITAFACCYARKLPVPPAVRSAEPQPLTAMISAWHQLDSHAQVAKCCAYNLISEQIFRVAADPADELGAALRLRQLVELAFWGVFYQFGLTVSFNLLRRKCAEKRKAYLRSKHIADFACAPFRPSPRRITDAWGAVGAATDTIKDEPVSSEIDAAIKKQKQIVMRVAEQVGLVAEAEQLGCAHRFLSSLVHVTPVLLHTRADGNVPRESAYPSFPRLAWQTLCSVTRLVDSLVFSPRFDFGLLPVAARVAPERPNEIRFAEIEFPELEDLRTKDWRVVIPLIDGGVLKLSDGRKPKR